MFTKLLECTLFCSGRNKGKYFLSLILNTRIKLKNISYVSALLIQSINDDISEEIYSCDYTRFETQLERLNLQTKINHETQLKQQKLLFDKINELSLQIKGIEAKLLQKHEIE